MDDGANGHSHRGFVQVLSLLHFRQKPLFLGRWLACAA